MRDDASRAADAVDPASNASGFVVYPSSCSDTANILPPASDAPAPPRETLCECGHDHLRPLGMGHVRIEACWEWPRCECYKFRPASPAQEATPPREELVRDAAHAFMRAWTCARADSEAVQLAVGCLRYALRQTASAAQLRDAIAQVDVALGAAPTPEASTPPFDPCDCDGEDAPIHQPGCRHAAPEASAPEPTDAALLKDLEESYRTDHHFANIADHPAMKWRVDRDVEGAIEPIAARFAQYRATVAALTADNENLELSRDRWEAEALRLTAERGARAQGQEQDQPQSD